MGISGGADFGFDRILRRGFGQLAQLVEIQRKAGLRAEIDKGLFRLRGQQGLQGLDQRAPDQQPRLRDQQQRRR